MYEDDSPPFPIDDFYGAFEDAIIFGNVQTNDYDWDDLWFWTEFRMECVYDINNPVYEKSCTPNDPAWIEYDYFNYWDKKSVYDIPGWVYPYAGYSPASDYQLWSGYGFNFYYSSAGDFIAFPSPNMNGYYYVPYMNHDQKYWSWWSAGVEIYWTPVNDPPVVTPYIYYTGENGYLDVPPSYGILYYTTDVDSPPQDLSAVLVSPPASALEWVFNADGSFYYVPVPNFYGYDLFTVVVILTFWHNLSFFRLLIKLTILHQLLTKFSLNLQTTALLHKMISTT